MVRKDLSAHSSYRAALAREWLTVVVNRDRNMGWCCTLRLQISN